MALVVLLAGPVIGCINLPSSVWSMQKNDPTGRIMSGK